jgi:hypothetical protein
VLVVAMRWKVLMLTLCGLVAGIVVQNEKQAHLPFRFTHPKI